MYDGLVDEEMNLDISTPFFHVNVPSPFGPLLIAWEEVDQRARVSRIFLPNEQELAQEVIQAAGSVGAARTCAPITDLQQRMAHFLEGDAVSFDLDVLALDRCSVFQRRVLIAEYNIPRGSVSTYGRIARHLGHPRASRAVGGALASNPFPIVIPCHRAVRSDGRLGGFRGGLEMKRALLQMEGVDVIPSGRVITDRFHYD